MFDFEEESLLANAATAGFELVQYHTDSGQSVQEWQRADGPKPQFVTRRVALYWMAQYLHDVNSTLRYRGNYERETQG